MALPSRDSNEFWEALCNAVLMAVERELSTMNVYVGQLLSFDVEQYHDLPMNMRKCSLTIKVGTDVVAKLPFSFGETMIATGNWEGAAIRSIATALVPQMLLTQDQWAVPDVK